MNEPTRRQKIEAMLAEDPQDVFLRYSLAMEWQKEERFTEALETFGQLINDRVPHVASFFMAAKLESRLGKLDRARDLLRRGIEQARQQGDLHAAGEMSEFLAGLPDDGDLERRRP